MRIAILRNEAGSKIRWPNESISDESSGECADSVKDALEKRGHDCFVINVGSSPGNVIEEIRRYLPDVVFNLCETVGQNSSLEPAIPFLLRWMNIPFTGNSPEALSVSLNKVFTKRLLRDFDIKTPNFLSLTDDKDLASWESWPAILKPSFEDASIGIDNGSVVKNAAAAVKRFSLLKKKFGLPVLIEEYIDGREINVAVLETERDLHVGINEIDFSSVKPGKPRIITYNAKWVKNTKDFRSTPIKAPANLEPSLDWKIRLLARQIFNSFCLSGYARIDFRVDKLGVPWVLEINPNPDISETDGGFSNSLPEMGFDYASAIESIVFLAIKKNEMPS
ncbi:ATP-grasp domain-containing protein [bacterium]|nr:ATP-grasp domain-containing protein [bacterium]